MEAVDLAVHKYVDNPTIVQGGISTWELHVETSEYVIDAGVAGLGLVDVTPDGLCPIGSTDTRCTVTQPDPSPPYTATTFNAPGPGQNTLEWDLSAETMGRSETLIVSFATETLTAYSDGSPVSANDSWTNTVDLTADVTTFGPDGPAEPDGFDLNAVVDDSAADQSGTEVAFRKDVGRPADGQECGDGADVLWHPDSVANTGPGDRICFRLTVDPPTSLDTIEASLTDFLPPGLRYEDGSSTPGPDNEVPEENVEDTQVTGSPETGQRIDWVLVPSSSVEPAQTAQVVFAAVLDGGVTPDLVESGESLTNHARVTYQNSSGEIFTVADDASAELTEAHLALVKGISRTAPTTGDPTTYDPPVDTVTDVTGGTAITYAVQVTNGGASDALDVEVHDLLAVNDQGIGDQDATCERISAVSDGGTCAGDDIAWTGLTVPAGETITLTYTWTMAATVPVAASWTNTAGVVEYHSTTNTGDDYVYVPRDNVDPDREDEANTDPADDDAHVFAPGISMTKTRTTSVEEGGNAAANQATIGETISYTVETRQSANTTATDYLLVDDLTGTGLALAADTVEVQTSTVEPGAACTYADPPITPGPDGPLTVTGETIEYSVAELDLTDQDGCLVLRFDAVVQDVPDTGETLNVRPGSVRNEAELTYSIDTGDGTAPGSVSAHVDTQVVEPNIAIDKRVTTSGTVLPGAQVTYQLVVTNVSGRQVATAHDVAVLDDFSGASVATVVDPGGGTVDGETIAWDLAGDPDGDGAAGLSPGASVTLTYTVQLEDNLEAGAELTNTATVTTSSVDGASEAERTDGSACSPGECPGYIDEDPATVTVGGPSITKGVLRDQVTIGQEYVYVIEATLPAHLDFGPDVVTVADDLSGGATTFVETVDVSCAGCSDEERAQFVDPEGNGTSTTDSPRWDLAVFGPAGVAREVVITFRARVEDDPATAVGGTLTNTATLTYVNGTLTDDATVAIVEPEVSLEKRVGSSVETEPRGTTPDTPVPGVVGGTVTYELAVTNNGTSTAYDTVVTDEPDSVSSQGDCSADARLEVASVADGAGWAVTDGTLGAGDACLGFTVPTLLPRQTIVITYALTVSDGFPRSDLIEGNEFVNLAEATEYFGLDDADREDNPDVRGYPAEPLTAAGHVDLAGAALGDLVWLDVDADGLGPDSGDTGEPGLAGVTVTVSGPSGTLTRVTDADGRWLTDDGSVPPEWLAAGEYTVTVDTTTLPPGLTNTADPDGGLDSTAVAGLEENEVDLTQDFGYAGEQSVGDTVWLDITVDGVHDDGEPGIPDVTLDVVWAGPDGQSGTDDDVDYGPATTDADGLYLVTGLPAGPVTVTVDTTTLPDGLVPTFDLDGGEDSTAVRVVEPGEAARDVDFGYAGTATVGDRVWFDLNGDGVQDDAEPGISAVDLEITWAGFDGDLGTAADNITVTRTTDADGLYLVEGVPAGDVQVSVQTDTLPPGLEQTFDADGTLDDETVRTLSLGTEDRDADFGYRGVHTIGDLVWFDVDADGLGPDTGDTGEPGVSGQQVAAAWAGADGAFGTADDVALTTVSTDADGRWTVTGVPDGLVRVSLGDGPARTLEVSADPDGTLDGTTDRTITADDLDIDFGLTGNGSIGDFVWFDFNGDGVQDDGEPPIPDVTLGVVFAGPDEEFGTDDDIDYGSVTTDAAGAYLVGDLPPGLYRVTVDSSTVPSGLVPTFDLDGGDDETADRALAAGENAADVDFGYRGEGEAGDYVWWDLDSDGAQGEGEPGLPGIAVTLLWAGFDGVFDTADDGTLVTTTDEGGGYLFTGLPAGDFVVAVDDSTLPAGMTQTADPDDTPDSQSAFSLEAGGSDLDLDFGYVGEFELGDLVWLDTDRDGARQPEEEALEDIAITVRYLGVDGAVGGGDDVVITTSTSVGGAAADAAAPRVAGIGGDPLPGEPFYLVTGLVPGAYEVVMDAATLPDDHEPLSDLDGDDPTVTQVSLVDVSVLDADFGVFRNDPPDVGPPEVVEVVCGDTFTIDPADGVTDVNGDTLQLVEGSVEAPDGVDVTVTGSGELQVVTAIDTDYTLRWQVTDGRGATVTVELEVHVGAACDEGGGDEGGGDEGGGDEGGGDDDLVDTGSAIDQWCLLLALAMLLAGASVMTLRGRARRTG